jgi:hypothetical protein
MSPAASACGTLAADRPRPARPEGYADRTLRHRLGSEAARGGAAGRKILIEFRISYFLHRDLLHDACSTVSTEVSTDPCSSNY